MALRLKKLKGLEDELNALHQAHPDDLHLRGVLRCYLETKMAFGTTRDIRNTAVYAQAQRIYQSYTGVEWSGNA